MEQRNKKSEQIRIKKYLPHNFLAEKSILSTLLINGQTIEFIVQHLTVETFYFRNHQELYRAIIFLHKKKLQLILLR
jgi:replicative DNA helicase